MLVVCVMLATAASAPAESARRAGTAAKAGAAPERPAAAATAPTGKGGAPVFLATGRVDRAVPPGFDPSCPAGKVGRILDCPEVVCPCQRGKNIVVARSFDAGTGCCNAPSCDELCAKRNRCPRFECPCGVPGDKAAATDDATGACITDRDEVCRRACGTPTKEARRR